MGLFQKAVETYDYMENLVGVECEERKAVLAPIGFITTGVQIQITVTEDGELKKAERIFEYSTDKKGKMKKLKKKIIIPATEESAGRSSGSAKFTPHPLCDKLMYFCPDCNDGKSYEAYLSQLKAWCEFDPSCSEIKSVLKYVEKGKIREDIEKYIKGAKDDDFVCWKVLSADLSEPEETWRSQSVINSYVRYCRSKVGESSEKALCYVSGKIEPVAQQHLKGIVSFFGNAKLVSSNHGDDFTYRGRFLNAADALTMGFDSSQKAHNALKWIIANDGFRFGNRNKNKDGARMMICWNPKGKKVPNPVVSLIPKLSNTNERPTPTNYRKILAHAVLGYKSNLDLTDETITAVFGASSDGRLSICYYSEMRSHDFLERLRLWDETIAWEHPKFGVTSPSLEEIVDAAYGVLHTDEKKQTIETSEKILPKAMQRLLLCRLEGAPFPVDIMRSAVQKCSFLQLYNEENRKKQLFATCAIIKKYRKDRFKEEWIMALEPEKKNRSYQFGRLLAVMEKAERDTFNSGENREPNAMRMQAVFVKRPMYAAKIIIEQLKKVYFSRLPIGVRNYYDKLIGEIMLMISEFSDSDINRPLGEEYLIGYYLQKNALYTKRSSDKNESEDVE